MTYYIQEYGRCLSLVIVAAEIQSIPMILIVIDALLAF